MGTLLITLLTLALLGISAFIVLIILMQRTSQSGGMGAALGGGAAESAFGADTNNVLTKSTIYGIISFFVVALGLYLLFQAQYSQREATIDPSTLLIPGEEEAAAETVTTVAPDATGIVPNDSAVTADGSEVTVDASAIAPIVDEGTISSFADSVEATVENLESEATGALENADQAVEAAAEEVPASK